MGEDDDDYWDDDHEVLTEQELMEIDERNRIFAAQNQAYVESWTPEKLSQFQTDTRWVENRINEFVRSMGIVNYSGKQNFDWRFQNRNKTGEEVIRIAELTGSNPKLEYFTLSEFFSVTNASEIVLEHVLEREKERRRLLDAKIVKTAKVIQTRREKSIKHLKDMLKAYPNEAKAILEGKDPI